MATGQPKKVPLKERALMMGNMIGINALRVNRTLLKQRFSEGGYAIHETDHFLLFTREQAPSIIVAHWFAPETIDANIGGYFIEELKLFGIIECPEDLSNLYGVIVGSLNPLYVRDSWRLYANNTIERYRAMIEDRGTDAGRQPMDEFASLYRRVLQLLVGESVLDAGCSFGFLPLLIAEFVPSIKQIVGVDIQTNSFTIVEAIARERQFDQVEFKQADLLSNHFRDFGQFDNVLALHVLEHFNETDMYRVLPHLLKVTKRRLIVAVPYEPGEAESAYGHQQLFTSAKLKNIGQWCVDNCGDVNSVLSEDSIGGLLVIDKQSLASAL